MIELLFYMQICTRCGKSFPAVVVIEGRRLDLRNRKRCLDCLAHRPLKGPRKHVVRPVAYRTCESCGEIFPSRMVIDGKVRYLYRRRFCSSCSPFGAHNTSKMPPRVPAGAELVEHRRRKRNAKTYRWLKRHRVDRKIQLIETRGGKCMDCGYSACLSALELHHRNRSEKEFGLGQFSGSVARYLAEAQKCDLVCANCHRLCHMLSDPAPIRAEEADARTRLKQRAVDHMGGACFGCARRGPLTLFEFHHTDATTKDFGISQDGIARSWAKIAAELMKCVMLCANCHREVHAGVRTIRPTLLGLAEETQPYVA